MGNPSTQLKKRLKEFKVNVGKKYGVSRMILFGSQARGDATRGSDVDLIIVGPKKTNRKRLVQSMYKEWHIGMKIGLPVDFLCYTPKQFESLKKEISIVSQAIDEGFEF